MADNSRHFGGTSADIISRASPTGVTVATGAGAAAAWTVGAWVYQVATGLDGRGIIRIGPAGATTRGVLISTTASGAIEYRSDADNIDTGTAFGTGAWHFVQVTRAGAGVANVAISVDGTALITSGTSAPTELSAGDVFRISDNDANLGRDWWNGRVAWPFFLKGVALSAAGGLAFGNNPQSLVTSYGPSGSVTANALKVLWPMQCSNASEVDKSGVGNDGTITGTSLGSADGPSPTTPWSNVCSAGSFVAGKQRATSIVPLARAACW